MKHLKLSPTLIQQHLRTLNKPGTPPWQLITTPTSQHISVHYQLPTFKTTWKFLNQIADHSHKLKHHPTITTTYNQVDLKLTTHDSGNYITDLDIQLAKEIQQEYQQYKQ
ncbi:putative pterin-4-alpha-carbinolamine dehydratase [Spathaspora sp. JA1]|nr:putative pterin-4-alpha-carbinolamine dehydratase [Spathaspora sp. JA1]